MDFAFTPEQDALREQAREFLAANPEPTWRQLADLGWTGVSVAEEHGGAGLGFLEEAILFEEMGRALTTPPTGRLSGCCCRAPPELQADVATGISSWALATGPSWPTSTRHQRRDHRRRLDLGTGGAEREATDARRDAAARRGLRGDAGRRLALRGPAQLDARSQRWHSGERRRQRALELAVGYVKEREQFGSRSGSTRRSRIARGDADRARAGPLARAFAAWCIAGT
jgi:alkylation response protein AidB-like acyl-CoA dehydrogenase